MSFYVYRPTERAFLALDESSWTEHVFAAAGFSSRQLADDIAVRQLGAGHNALVFDDGQED